MNDTGWLKQSLLEAREETARLPEWAREIMSARDAYYGPQGFANLRSNAAGLEGARRIEAAEREHGAPEAERG